MTHDRALEGESSAEAEAEAATRRADENVALSLEVFGELFDKLSPEGKPFPPPTGRPAPVEGRASGRQAPGLLRRTDPGGGRRAPSAPARGGSPFEPGGPRRGWTAGAACRDGWGYAALLQSVLTFYDRFAPANEANPRLQGEAAWAYFKVGALYEQMGRDGRRRGPSRVAMRHARGPGPRFPDDAEYRSRLVEIAIMAEPWSADPSSLDRLEGRLRRARSSSIGWRRGARGPGLHPVPALRACETRRGAPAGRVGRTRRRVLSSRHRPDGKPSSSGTPDCPRHGSTADIREALAMLLFERGGQVTSETRRARCSMRPPRTCASRDGPGEDTSVAIATGKWRRISGRSARPSVPMR